MVGANCRGNSTADVRFSGLEDGTIARVNLKGFIAHERHRGFILVRPFDEGKSLRLVGLVLLGRRITGSGFACLCLDGLIVACP